MRVCLLVGEDVLVEEEREPTEHIPQRQEHQRPRVTQTRVGGRPEGRREGGGGGVGQGSSSPFTPNITISLFHQATLEKASKQVSAFLQLNVSLYTDKVNFSFNKLTGERE